MFINVRALGGLVYAVTDPFQSVSGVISSAANLSFCGARVRLAKPGHSKILEKAGLNLLLSSILSEISPDSNSTHIPLNEHHDQTTIIVTPFF